MKYQIASTLAVILLAALHQSNGLNSLALPTRNSRASIVPRSRLSVATTQLEQSTSDSDDSTTQDVEFPPPLSPWDRTKRAATFYSTVVPIIANYYGLIGNLKVQELLGTGRFSEEEIEVCDMTQWVEWLRIETRTFDDLSALISEMLLFLCLHSPFFSFAL